MQPASPDELSYLLNIIWFGLIILLSVYGQKIQMFTAMRQIRRALSKLKRHYVKAQKITVKMVKELGKPDTDPTSRIKEFIDFVFIEPVSLDPAGILKRLEHLLDVRKRRFEQFVKKIAPQVSAVESMNIEGTLEATIALNMLYRIVRHFYILGRKTSNPYQIIQLQMILPQVMEYASAYYRALKAFSCGAPIGDGVGPLIVEKIVYSVKRSGGDIERLPDYAEDIVVEKVQYQDRDLLLVRAKGPGSTVGKPGEAIKRLMSEYHGKVKRVITIDAGLKLEGDTTGELAEGVGAAIGDPGPEKSKIEVSSETQSVPVDAIIIKQSIEEAITPLRKSIFESADDTVKRVKRILMERTNPNDLVIIAGIGNTSGVGFA
ncbi:MAG: DUF1512 domain-containing protein [Candidatus Ranarchaeia archaeon]